MHIEGGFVLKASSQSVYNFFLDPNQISQCIPGFQRADVISPDDFAVVLKPASSSSKARSKLYFTVAQKDGAEYAKFLVKGLGKDAEVGLELTIHIEDSEIGSSLVKWEAEARLGGQLAHVASEKLAREAERLVAGVANCLRVRLEPKRS